MSRISAAEVPGGNALPVALVRQQLDEPGFVFDLFVENARSHVISARVFAESHVADLDPAADRTALRLQQQSQNVYGRRRIGQLRGFAASLIVERGQVVGQFDAQL